MKPFVRDWATLPAQVMRPGVTRVGVGTTEVSVQIATLRRDMTLNPHQHPYEQIALILSGEGFAYLGDQRFAIGPRSLITIPSNVRHYIEVTSEEPMVNIDVFAPARADLAELFAWMETEEPVHYE